MAETITLNDINIARRAVDAPGQAVSVAIKMPNETDERFLNREIGRLKEAFRGNPSYFLDLADTIEQLDDRFLASEVSRDEYVAFVTTLRVLGHDVDVPDQNNLPEILKVGDVDPKVIQIATAIDEDGLSPIVNDIKVGDRRALNSVANNTESIAPHALMAALQLGTAQEVQSIITYAAEHSNSGLLKNILTSSPYREFDEKAVFEVAGALEDQEKAQIIKDAIALVGDKDFTRLAYKAAGWSTTDVVDAAQESVEATSGALDAAQEVAAGRLRIDEGGTISQPQPEAEPEAQPVPRPPAPAPAPAPAPMPAVKKVVRNQDTTETQAYMFALGHGDKLSYGNNRHVDGLAGRQYRETMAHIIAENGFAISMTRNGDGTGGPRASSDIAEDLKGHLKQMMADPENFEVIQARLAAIMKKPNSRITEDESYVVQHTLNALIDAYDLDISTDEDFAKRDIGGDGKLLVDGDAGNESRAGYQAVMTAIHAIRQEAEAEKERENAERLRLEKEAEAEKLRLEQEAAAQAAEEAAIESAFTDKGPLVNHEDVEAAARDALARWQEENPNSALPHGGLLFVYEGTGLFDRMLQTDTPFVARINEDEKLEIRQLDSSVDQDLSNIKYDPRITEKSNADYHTYRPEDGNRADYFYVGQNTVGFHLNDDGSFTLDMDTVKPLADNKFDEASIKTGTPTEIERVDQATARPQFRSSADADSNTPPNGGTAPIIPVTVEKLPPVPREQPKPRPGSNITDGIY